MNKTFSTLPMLSDINASPRIVLFSLLLSVAFSSITLGQGSTTVTEYQASIGSGTHYIHFTIKGSNCGGPINNSGDFTVENLGPLTLVSTLPLIKVGTQWLPGTVTATGPTSTGIGPQTSNAVGGSTYVSTLSVDGIATTVETGSYTITLVNGSDSGTMTSTETINLNSGQYTWVRTFNHSTSGSCPSSTVETQNRTATLPISLSPITPSASLAVVASLDDGPQVSTTAQSPTANFPLGSRFSIQLVKIDQSGNQQPLTCTFDMLGSASISPAITGNTLFPNDVAIEFDSVTADTIKYFQAVHLGTVVLTITPTDPSLSPVGVTLNITVPKQLGTTPNQYDTALINFGHRRGIPPEYLKGQVQQESGFKPQGYRYEPLSADLAYTSKGKDPTRIKLPYSLYRLATSDGFPQGTATLPADISPRSNVIVKFGGQLMTLYDIVVNGQTRLIMDSDQYVSAQNIYLTNDPILQLVKANWSRFSPGRATAVIRNVALLDFTAQTTIAASYGLLQVMYATAIAPMGWEGIHGAKNPSYLFDTDANLLAGGGSLDLGSGYLALVFGTANPTVNSAAPRWTSQDDFDTAFTRAFNFYNHGTPVRRNPNEVSYGEKVMDNASPFTPVATGSIFLTQ